MPSLKICVNAENSFSYDGESLKSLSSVDSLESVGDALVKSGVSL